MAKIKPWIEGKLSVLVLIFIILHPLLDVLSYFLAGSGDNTISTLSRFAVLAVIALTGFIVSDRKKQYFIFFGVIILFWILHCLNCYRIGYKSIVSDTSNYLRIISLPIYTMSLVTFFRKGKNIGKSIYTGFAVSLALVVIFTAIPWLTGRPEFTYDVLGLGVSGWFSVKSAQSAIVALLAPMSIYFGYKSKNYIVYVISLIVSIGLMFLTGTKLTYYSIFLICVAFMFLFLINLKGKSLIYILPVFAVLAASIVFRQYSPSSVRDGMTAHAQGNYKELVEASVKSKSSTIQRPEKQGPLPPYSGMERQRKAIFGVYTDKDVYGKLYRDINDRFGVYNVMSAFDFTTDPTILSDTRERKSYFAKLVWNEKDNLTHLFGFEYDDMIHRDTNYDLENDFPAVFYFCGYIGFALYMSYFAYIAFVVIRAFLRNANKFLSIEMGVVGMSFILAIGAAQISGNVLRRPNVTGYFALIAAYLYYLSVLVPLPPGAMSAKELLQNVRKKLHKPGKKSPEK